MNVNTFDTCIKERLETGLGLSNFIDTAIYINILFSDKVSIFQPQLSSFFFTQTLLKSQTLQLAKTQNINIIQYNAKGGHIIQNSS